MPSKEYFEFPYARCTDGAFRPFIEVSITNFSDNKYSKKFLCLIDSGADSCVFPAAAAELLGHNLYKGTKTETTGISGVSIPIYAHKNYITISDGKNSKTYSTMIQFIECNNTPFILGHAGLFTHFKVRFNYDSKKVSLEPYPHRFSS